MNNIKYLHKFTDHLEFLGYKIDPLESDEAGSFDMAIAKHSKLNNYVLLAQKDLDFLFIQVRLNFKKRVATIMYEYLDEVNGNLNVSRAFIDEDESQLILQTHWTGAYDKNLFGEFLNLFSDDQQILVSMPDFEKIWV